LNRLDAHQERAIDLHQLSPLSQCIELVYDA
jgi:hypothetical protein